MSYTIHTATLLEACQKLPDHTFDALLGDPPYGLSFMGKSWDYDVPTVAEWQELLRVLKPGAPIVVFGGSRTYHRLAVNLEDAGAELRDTLCYLYAKGMPKALNVSKALDKAAGATRPIVGTRILTGNAGVSLKDKGGTYGVQVGTAGNVEVPVTASATDLAKQWEGYATNLKPCHEPIVLARKPLDGTVAHNVATWGCGALNIDACRITRSEGDESGWSHSGSPAGDNLALAGASYARPPKPDASGRWPSNVLLDESAAQLLDATVGNRPSTKGKRGSKKGSILGKAKGQAPDFGYDDNGGPSRFFFTAKVSTKERNAGITSKAGCSHPTLKPISLTTWLAKLLLPANPQAKLLVPWSGAGSEMIGAGLAGWTDITGIEMEAEYVAFAQDRLAYWLG
jgi:site-specific DNA-methyltransferase (adenine-specific)